MLIILTTHPIQYQVPLWQALAKDGRVPFEVWYLTHHAVQTSHDAEFGKAFAWDLDMLGGYPHRLLPVAPGATPTSFRQCRVTEPLEPLLRQAGAKAVWVQGWQVQAYWQAVWAAKRAGCEVWLRGESNDLAPVAWWKRPIKHLLLGQFFRRVDRFLCIGAANRRFYQKFGVVESRLHPAPYAVDNDRFAQQATEARKERAKIRKQWSIAEDAFCVMFCGKFIPKKRPLDLVAAAAQLMQAGRKVHLLFVGAGELGSDLRAACRVVFDAEHPNSQLSTLNSQLPAASFPGFLNQTEISRAYVAADCLVLPSDYGETWGLVANEAMASGLPGVISEQCGCAEDLGVIPPNQVFPCGDTAALADRLVRLPESKERTRAACEALADYSFARSVKTVAQAWQPRARG
jgi:glycosyltransferase involved in cell wall biosynthesis